MTDQDEFEAAQAFASMSDGEPPAPFVPVLTYCDFWRQHGPGDMLDRVLG